MLARLSTTSHSITVASGVRARATEPKVRKNPRARPRHPVTSTRADARNHALFSPLQTRGATLTRARSEDEAEDSSRYRSAREEKKELDGFIGKIVSNLPDGRKSDAPESYGSRPESRTLKEGRYARGDPIRAGLVREDTIRGEDFEVVESGLPSVGTLVTLAVGAAVLFGVYKVVELIGDAPAETPRRSSRRMPETDREISAPAVKAAPAPAAEP